MSFWWHWLAVIMMVVAPHHPSPMSDASSTNTPHWTCLRNAESGDDYTKAYPGEFKGGAYQFDPHTFRGLGFSGYAADAPPAEQDKAALIEFRDNGQKPWPNTAPECDLGQPYNVR